MANNSTLAGRLWNARRDARNRGIQWRLTNEEAFALFKGDCHWCGAPGPGGIDRRGNEPFYDEDNSVSCCKLCNVAKSTMKPNEWLAWIERVVEHSIAPVIWEKFYQEG